MCNSISQQQILVLEVLDAIVVAFVIIAGLAPLFACRLTVLKFSTAMSITAEL
jgi:hypothetical protein